MRNLSSKVRQTVLITGASSGIGHELTRLFARDGRDLVLVARDAARLARVAEELKQMTSAAVTVIPKDLARSGAAEEIVQELHGLGVEVDVLINDAGTQVYGEFAHSDLERQLALIHVNAAALVDLTHRLLPGMLCRGFGRILNVGSTGSFAPGPLNAVYCAAKAFVLSFSAALGAELAGTGVTVTALCPGPTNTAFATRHGMQDVRMFRKAMAPDHVARIGYRALHRGRPVVVAGVANQIQVLAFQLMAPFIGLTPPAWLMAIGKAFMGRSGSGQMASAATQPVSKQ
jgi:short-subunit dehydrogenase